MLATICRKFLSRILSQSIRPFPSGGRSDFEGAAYVGTRATPVTLYLVLYTHVSVPPTIATLYLVPTCDSHPQLFGRHCTHTILQLYTLHTHVSLPIVSKCIHRQSPCGLANKSDCSLIELCVTGAWGVRQGSLHKTKLYLAPRNTPQKKCYSCQLARCSIFSTQ